MNRPPIVIVDSDAIIAQVNPNDLLHTKSVNVSKRLSELNAQIVYPSTTVAESTAYMQRVLNSTATAYGTVQLLVDPLVNVAEINQQTLKGALKHFSRTTSKQNTLFDCIVVSVAEKYKADAIFSFDKFYKKKGFKLASEL